MVVHFIGAGPGAADLMTVRALRLLQQSGMCLYAGTYLDTAVLEHCPPGCELIDTQHLDLDQIVAAMIRADRAGWDVARLCSGDPSIFSAVSEQALRLDAAGIAWDITPGVPAYAAAAAVLGAELTVPELAQSIVLTRAQARSTPMPDSESLENFARTKATLVLHLAITRIRELATRIDAYYGKDCPAAVVYRASQPGEIVLRGTLSDIAEQVEAAGLRQAAVIIVGRSLGVEQCAQSHLYDPARRRD